MGEEEDARASSLKPQASSLKPQASKNRLRSLFFVCQVLTAFFLYFSSTLPTYADTHISVGEYHACAIRTDKTLVCWNRNSLAISPPEQFLQISSDKKEDSEKPTSCGITVDNSIRCWDVYDNKTTYPTPTGKYAQVVIYDGKACAIKTTDKTLVCWGRDGNTSTPSTQKFLKLATNSNGDQGCGILEDETINCWGIKNPVYPVGKFSQAFFTSTDYTNSICGLRKDGVLDCPENSKLADTNLLKSGYTFSQMSTAGGYLCGIRSDTKTLISGSVSCSGGGVWGGESQSRIN